MSHHNPHYGWLLAKEERRARNKGRLQINIFLDSSILHMPLISSPKPPISWVLRALLPWDKVVRIRIPWHLPQLKRLTMYGIIPPLPHIPSQHLQEQLHVYLYINYSIGYQFITKLLSCGQGGRCAVWCNTCHS